MQKQIVMYDSVKSVGYSLSGIVIKEYCEKNYIKLVNLFPTCMNFIIVAEK